MCPDLEIADCRALCRWRATEHAVGADRLFRCAGCGSEWVATEPWTPVDHTGVVPEEVRAERDRRQADLRRGAAGDAAGRSDSSTTSGS